MFKFIYSINMLHTFVDQFVRSLIDHYERISLYMKSFFTEIRMHVYHFLCPRFPKFSRIYKVSLHESLALSKLISTLSQMKQRYYLNV